MERMRQIAAIGFLVLTFACVSAVPPSPPALPAEGARPVAPADSHTSPTLESRTSTLQKIDGFIPLFWDAAAGRLLMQIGRFDEELILQSSLPAGVGSNPIGLDRGELSATHLVTFQRIGPKVLMVESNTRYRALTGDAAERRDVEDSFARSVLWGFKVEAVDANSVLVDATDFFLSDIHGVIRRLTDLKQGSFALDRDRSAIWMPRTKAFPRNTEVESILTFETHDHPGPLVSGVTPVPQTVSVREHYSFVALPEPGYRPRRVDPRVGVSGIELYDYASPFTGPLEKRWIARHRLEKADPTAAISEPVRPIVYYVDNGVPEPIRSALVEGASWWSPAFEAAGFRNAFQVRILPPDADPMDVRYNMINWVHRSTRGWSYGESVLDPRTGEIIKGNVRLGSLRIRQDVLIAEGLIPQFDELHDAALARLDPATSPSVMALARIRQLAAHEVGHTLGLDHNMAASSYGRASVMDYPAPYVKITDGRLDLSEAYARGIGPYDKFAIRFGYTEFPPGTNEDAELDRMVRCAAGDPDCSDQERANPPMLFIKDSDARPVSAAHPLASVWDGGNDPVAGLAHEVEVRRIALGQFGLGNLAVGEPLSSLEEKLLPLYLHHRYQLEAASKSIGGLYYTYAVKERNGVVPREVRRIVPAGEQRAALSIVLSTLDPSFLEIPQRILDLMPPRANSTESGIAELFDKRTTPVFDPIAAATVASDLTISTLLDPNRDARLVQFHAENSDNPSLSEVLTAVMDVALRQERGYRAAVTRATRSVLISRLFDLAANPDAAFEVRDEATEALRRLHAKLTDVTGADASEIANRHATRDEIERFLARPAATRTKPHMPEIPPGPPI
jgi:hypothetical protein